jgi:hypothetical protein
MLSGIPYSFFAHSLAAFSVILSRSNFMSASRSARCLAVFACAVAALARAAEPSIAGAIVSESGFDGAVTILEAVEDDGFEYVTAEVPYRDMRANVKTGQARVVVRSKELETGKPVPLFCHVHYEKDIDGAKKWCQRGWAVVTPHYDLGADAPLDVAIGDSNNLARAIIQWARRLPVADRSRLHIDGGSQGGYMALAMGAEFLPATSISADAPVMNWAYNLAYFERNRTVAQVGEVPPDQSPLPVMAMVSELASERMASSPVPGCYGVLTDDLSDDAWYQVSPISYLDRISCPTLIQIATGDMLVPHEQMTDRFPQDFSTVEFPKGYERDFQETTLNDKARKTFEETVDADDVYWELIPLPEGIFEFTLDALLGRENPPEDGPANIDRPWSKKHTWSVAVFDEGPPQPWSAHTRYKWPCSPDSFVLVHQEKTPKPEILNAAKLHRLMQRYAGDLEHTPTLRDGAPANRLNFPLLEQLDVVTGLLDYAGMGDAHRTRLERLYAQGKRKPLGAALGLDHVRSELRRIRSELGVYGPD